MVKFNNPLNIEINPAIHWEGMSPIQNGGKFVVYLAPEYCYRTATKLWETYAKEGVTTVAGYISKFSPSVENPTAQYIQNVCAWEKLTPDTVIGPDNLLALFRGMTRQEQGSIVCSDEIISRGIALAAPHLAGITAPAAPVSQAVVTQTVVESTETKELAVPTEAIKQAATNKTNWVGAVTVVASVLLPYLSPQAKSALQALIADPSAIEMVGIAVGTLLIDFQGLLKNLLKRNPQQPVEPA